ncbi:GNAT family N-acetyltransferase [Phenylobacterium sp.]|uniref:GNAT family N-acetyltransferase n=1 Tax=Phenylobacterium sp. TaxID=1871053 RepID=UPI002727917D|nr:GNAT family N-acetyltransferase [Phenylobacterium sp.]MDO8799020.1 GNAT family N-acetyltransferase [Phenylobacterium sp.]
MLVPLTPRDIPDLLQIERLPGYDAFIGQWPPEEHAAEMSSPAARYLGWREGGELTGFVIFQKFDQSTVRLRRIAVAGPGGGLGTTLLQAVVDWAFANTDAEAVDLHVRAGNDRARAVYAREGFVPSGEFEDDAEEMVVSRARWNAR